MSNHYIFILLFYSRMTDLQEFIVRNTNGLTKFEKNEHVLSALEEVAPGEVRVYKMDADGNVLRNERGNVVNYSLNRNRLREAEVNAPKEEDMNILQKRVLKKMFTDKALDAAADYEKELRDFVKIVSEVKVKLGKIANKLLGKLNDLNESVDYMNAEQFKSTMDQIAKIRAIIGKEPLDTITQLYEDLGLKEENEEYDAVQDILIDD